MPTEYPACSEADSAGSNRSAEAPRSEPASRSESEPETASLHQVRVANLSDVPKPEIRREEIFTRSGETLRGRSGRRAGKVGLGRLGEPCRQFRGWNETRRKYISGVLEARESERLVVVWKSRKRDGAKGPWQERSGLKESWELIGG